MFLDDNKVLVDPIVPGISGNSIKQISPAKNWCFTINNYTQEVIDYIVPIIQTECDVGFFSKEVGESGTPHLQGYLRFTVKKRPKSVFSEVDNIHWEKARGSLEQNVQYCSKEAELCFRHGLPRIPRVYTYTDLFPEQREVVDLLSEEPDDRTIIVCHAGYNKGKTSLARHVVYYMKGVILPTTKRHALSVARSNMDKHIFIFDLTADESDDPPTEFFECIESLKNGLFCAAFGSKGTGSVIMDFPNILILSNERPEAWNSQIDKNRFKCVSL